MGPKLYEDKKCISDDVIEAIEAIQEVQSCDLDSVNALAYSGERTDSETLLDEDRYCPGAAACLPSPRISRPGFVVLVLLLYTSHAQTIKTTVLQTHPLALTSKQRQLRASERRQHASSRTSSLAKLN